MEGLLLSPFVGAPPSATLTRTVVFRVRSWTKMSEKAFARSAGPIRLFALDSNATLDPSALMAGKKLESSAFATLRPRVPLALLTTVVSAVCRS